ncbi:PEP-CTERM sorting domain-containing protein [Alteromonas gilva]|uniref:PEP-CTERM sorting domain-containing protein n=1 Tax=Alteromonas gilva TaxID=2987522 RepID=A0ABT5KZ00_9ALTE|nr:PEP-CTERM sorting domain-containing protein [Alteromonas gilva]MDC8829877.1 PEP-CTERM sorting domain-containing protein [Alteromonas gilva]
MLKKLLVSVCALAFCHNASAALVSYNGYTLNESTNIVTGGGLQWLQWDLTIGQSVDDALAIYASQGWTIATNVQMAALFNTFVFGANTALYNGSINPANVPVTNGVWDTDENTTQYTYNRDGATIATDPEKQFVALFGQTYLNFPTATQASNPYEYSAAWFGIDQDGDGFHNVARVSDEYLRTGQTVANRGLTRLANDSILAEDIGNQTGVALVRAANVPEPAGILLFALGILGLRAVRGKRRTA